MARESNMLEWTILNEDDPDGDLWQWAEEPQLHKPFTLSHRARRWLASLIIGVAVVCLATGLYLWQQARAGLALVEADLLTSLEAETVAAQNLTTLPTAILDSEISPLWQRVIQQEPTIAASEEELVATIIDYELHRETAIVEVELRPQRELRPQGEETTGNTTAFKQIRFYRQIAQEWVRTEPIATLWGKPATLETPHLNFSYRERDALAIAAVAPKMERHYVDMMHALAIPLPPEHMQIEVNVTHPPGMDIAWRTPVVIPAPALYQVPVGMSETDLLAQSLALALIEHIRVESLHQDRYSPLDMALVDGILLWHYWQMDLPLSPVPDSLIQVVYAETIRDTPSIAPNILNEEWCAVQSQMPSTSLAEHMSLACAELRTGSPEYLSRTLYRAPTRLENFFTFSQPWREYYKDPNTLATRFWDEHPGTDEVIALAVLIDYATAAYETEQLSTLLVAGYSNFGSWETVLSAAFNLSTTEFEAGWQAHLHECYGVVIEP